MADIRYNTGTAISYNMSSFNLDAMTAGMTVTKANAFNLVWSSPSGLSSVAIKGVNLQPVVTNGVLTGLTGDMFTRLTVTIQGASPYSITYDNIFKPFGQFFQLYHDDNWTGLAAYLRQGNDYIVGDAKNDTLLGGAGNDSIYAGAGLDVVRGGAGDDLIYAAEGHDQVWGGAGADAFLMMMPTKTVTDVWVNIRDFQHGTDHLMFNISASLLGSVAGHVDPAEFFVDTAPTAAVPSLIYHQAEGLLYYDKDGSGDGLAVLLAKLGAGTVLTPEDCLVGF